MCNRLSNMIGIEFNKIILLAQKTGRKLLTSAYKSDNNNATVLKFNFHC